MSCCLMMDPAWKGEARSRETQGSAPCQAKPAHSQPILRGASGIETTSSAIAMWACPQTVQAARRRFAAQGLAASPLDSECVTGYSLLAMCSRRQITRDREACQYNLRKISMLFPRARTGSGSIQHGHRPTSAPLLFSCVDWTQRAAIPPRSSERGILAGFRESK